MPAGAGHGDRRAQRGREVDLREDACRHPAARRPGRIVVNGTDITGSPATSIPRHGLAYVPQNDNVFRTLTVRENLEVGGYASKKDPRARMKEVLDIVPGPRQSSTRRRPATFPAASRTCSRWRAPSWPSRPSSSSTSRPPGSPRPTPDVVWQQVELHRRARDGGACHRAERRTRAHPRAVRQRARRRRQPRPRHRQGDREARSRPGSSSAATTTRTRLSPFHTPIETRKCNDSNPLRGRRSRRRRVVRRHRRCRRARSRRLFTGRLRPADPTPS